MIDSDAPLTRPSCVDPRYDVPSRQCLFSRNCTYIYIYRYIIVITLRRRWVFSVRLRTIQYNMYIIIRTHTMPVESGRAYMADAVKSNKGVLLLLLLYTYKYRIRVRRKMNVVRGRRIRWPGQEEEEDWCCKTFRAEINFIFHRRHDRLSVTHRRQIQRTKFRTIRKPQYCARLISTHSSESVECVFRSARENGNTVPRETVLRFMRAPVWRTIDNTRFVRVHAVDGYAFIVTNKFGIPRRCDAFTFFLNLTTRGIVSRPAR